jgi:23S rRNA pseudouridine2605 synthase
MPASKQQESKSNKSSFGSKRENNKNKKSDAFGHISEKRTYKKKTDNTKNESPLVRKKPSNNTKNESPLVRKKPSNNTKNESHLVRKKPSKFQFDSDKKVNETRTSYNPSAKSKLRLNKYISNSGYCSRREADTLIIAGSVTVDGEIITELGYKVFPNSKIRIDNQPLTLEKHVYLILNKPKDFITTAKDPQGRKTVMHLIKGACRERLYPVGRLDKNSTGLLIMTNDGEFARKIAHPSSNIIKVYEVVLDKPISQELLNEIGKGVQLDDGFVHVDNVSFVENAKTKNVVGVEIHSGKYHVVKRIFEKYGFIVLKLDRTRIDILTKKNLPRGKWRFLTDSEVQLLKRL